MVSWWVFSHTFCKRSLSQSLYLSFYRCIQTRTYVKLLIVFPISQDGITSLSLVKFTIKISYFTKRLFLFRWIAIHMAIFLLLVFIHRIARLLVLYFFSTIATCTCPHNALPERSTNFKFIPVFIYSKIVMHKSLQMFINFLRSVNNLLHNLLSLFPCIAYLRTKYAKHSIEIVD